MNQFGQNFNNMNQNQMFQLFQIFMQQMLMNQNNFNPNFNPNNNFNPNFNPNNNFIPNQFNMNNMNNMNFQNFQNMYNNMNFQGMNMNNMNFQTFQNMYNNMNNTNNMNNNFNNINVNDGRNNPQGGAPKGVIERVDKVLQINDFKNVNQNSLINVHLHASSGLKVVLKAPNYITVKELLRLYVKKLGLPESFIGTKIIFIYNAITIDLKSQQTLNELFKGGIAGFTLTVIDVDDVIGANSF